MSIINQPPTTAVDRLDTDNYGIASLPGVMDGWRNFFNSVYTICNALTMNGTTAKRPTVGLWTGRMYFDTTLGYPIWYKTAGWVNSAGAAV